MANNIVFFLIYTIVSIIYFMPLFLNGYSFVVGDSWAQNYPLMLYYSKHFLSNGFHLWLPYQFLGLPFLGMLQTGLLYPYNLLYIFLPTLFVFNLSVLLHYTLAAFFTFLFIRLLGVNKLPAFVAGLIFGYSGFLMAHKGHIPIINAAVWLPLLLFLYEKIRCSFSLKYSAWAAVVIGIQVFAGHYQISVYTYLILGLFTVFFLNKINKEKRTRFALLCLGPVIMGSIIALPQLIATKELADFAWRTGQEYRYFTEYSFPPFMLASLVFPFIFGNWGYAGPYWGAWNLTEMAGFVGILPLVLGIWAAIRLWGKNTHIMFLALLAIIAFLLVFGRHNPFYRIMYYIPIYNFFRVPARHWLEFDLAIAVLSAFGLQYLLNGSDLKKKSTELLLALGILGVCSLAFLVVGKSLVSTVFESPLLTQETHRLLAHAFSFHNPAVFIPLGFLCLYIVWTYLLIRIESHLRLSKKMLVGAVAVLILVEGFSFGGFNEPYNSFIKLSEIRNKLDSPLINFLKTKTSYERTLFVSNYTVPLFNVPSQVHRLNGYEPLIPQGVHELLDMYPNNVSTNWTGLLQNNLILSTLNVRYVMVLKQDVQKYKLDEIKTTQMLSSRNISLGRWDLINSREAGKGEFILVSSDGHTVSMLRQQLSLRHNTVYVLSLEARSVEEKATAMLSYDLYSPNYDSHDQELDVEARELKQAYRTFYRIINTGNNIPPQVELRVFTFSRKPIAVRNIEVKELDNFAPPYIAGQYPGEKEGVPIYQKVFESSDWVVYKNESCLPRAFTVSNLGVASDIRDIKKKFELFEFNPAETALVSHEDMARIGRTNFTKGTAKIENYDTDRIVIDAEFRDGPGFLVLTDQYFPGWKAFVDGKETTIYKVDGLLRGVVVPEGRHTVEFKYRPEKLFIAGLFSIIALLVTLFIALKC